MQCPICGAPAKHLSESFDGVVVACPRCGDYRVSEDCFNGLLRLDLESRTQALCAAHKAAAPGARPTISSLAQPSWWRRTWRAWRGIA